jgi:hypothetical protein
MRARCFRANSRKLDARARMNSGEDVFAISSTVFEITRRICSLDSVFGLDSIHNQKKGGIEDEVRRPP